MTVVYFQKTLMVTWVTVTKRTAFVCVARAVDARVVMTTIEILAFLAIESWQTGAVVVAIICHVTGRVVFAG